MLLIRIRSVVGALTIWLIGHLEVPMFFVTHPITWGKLNVEEKA